ncbi:MAG TPA: hypothetical protein VJM15_07175 [Sphingomicrobium sp.]|nr:hypothetical protein [Sphingomicrobium sp.]
MPTRTLLALPILTVLAACAGPVAPPSLLPRAAEAIDPRLPVVRPINDRPVRPALASRLAELVGLARSGDAAFRPAVETAERLAAAAGERQSESWIAAQEALSAAIAARSPTALALGEIDALGADKLQAQGGLAPNDLEAIKAAAADVGAIDRRQAETIAKIQRRLGG